MGLILLYPSPPSTTKCLLPPFGHGLCCWNKRDVFIRTGCFRACWVAGRRGKPRSRVALLGTQAPPRPDALPASRGIGVGSGLGCANVRHRSRLRVQPPELSLLCCSPARAPETQPSHLPQNFYFYINHAHRQSQVSAASAVGAQRPTHEKTQHQGLVLGAQDPKLPGMWDWAMSCSLSLRRGTALRAATQRPGGLGPGSACRAVKGSTREKQR